MDGVTNSMHMSLSKLQEMVKDKEGWRAQSVGPKESDTAEGLNNNNNNKDCFRVSQGIRLRTVTDHHYNTNAHPNKGAFL